MTDSLASNSDEQTAINENLLAAFISSTAGALIFLLLPVIVGWLADKFRLDEQAIGSVVSIYFFGFLVTSILAFMFFGSINRLRILQTGYLVLIPALLSISFAPSLVWLMGSLVFSGLACGLLYGVGLSIVSSTSNSEQNFGGMMATQQAFAIVLIYSLPVWVMPTLGYEAVWLVLAGVIFAMSFSLIGFKIQAVDQTSTEIVPVQSASLNLTYLFLHFCLLSAVWAFLERLGVTRGYSATDMATALALSLAGGLGGAILVTLLADRLGKTLPHLLVTVLFISILTSFMVDLGWTIFLVAIVLFSFGWTFCLAYQMASVGNLSDRYAVLIPGVQGTAAMLGPILGGWLITNAGFNGLMMVASLMVLLTGMGFVIQAKLDAKQSIPTTAN